MRLTHWYASIAVLIMVGHDYLHPAVAGSALVMCAVIIYLEMTK